MAYAHKKGIAHRDLKPENIMVDDFGSILIMDWGLAKDFKDPVYDDPIVGVKDSEETSDIALTVNGEITGTPAYMSPEQALGMVKQINFTSDVFSMGIILYELLTGRNPFVKKATDDWRAVIACIKKGEIRVPEKDINGKRIRKELQAICMKCLEQLPADRYQTSGELYEDLMNYDEGRPVSAYRTGIRESVNKWIGRHVKTLLFVAVILIGIVIFWAAKISADNEFEGYAELARGKIEEVKRTDIEIEQIRERIPRLKDIRARKHAINHLPKIYLERESNWNTAKSNYMYIISVRPNYLDEKERDEFIKLWVEAIDILITQKNLNRAERSYKELKKLLAEKKSMFILDKNIKMKMAAIANSLGE